VKLTCAKREALRPVPFATIVQYAGFHAVDSALGNKQTKHKNKETQQAITTANDVGRVSAILPVDENSFPLLPALRERSSGRRNKGITKTNTREGAALLYLSCRSLLHLIVNRVVRTSWHKTSVGKE
jgi:hypothetical protein